MKPLILNYATERTGDITPMYEYNFELSMNMMDFDGQKIPFIDADTSQVSMLTKTKVKNENDDDSLSLLELKTKTEVRLERDDKHPTLLELQTKSFTKQEGEDK